MSIAVTGIGIVSAIGVGVSETLAALRSGSSGIGTMRHLASTHTELPVGEVKMSNDDMRQRLGIASERLVSRTALLGAMAIKEAVAGRQLAGRCYVVSGTTVGGMDVTERIFKHIDDSDDMLRYISKHDCGSNTQEMVQLAGLDCEACTVSTACSSALNAIMLGCEMLCNGEADVVIAGGTEALSLFHLNGFNSLMILDHERCRPFDKMRAGLNLGEGAAYLVLQRTDDVDATEAKAYITGYGNKCDAFHQTASSDNGEGAFLAMTEALRMAGLQPCDIDYINAHGTGTPNNDASESAALRRVFAECMPPVSSTKAYTGHTTSASGAIESVISIIAMMENFLPANIGWSCQDEDCIAPYASGMEGKEKALHHVLCNSFGFGGNDSSMVISRQPSSSSSVLVNSGEVQASCQVVSDITIDDESQLAEAKEYIPPMQARRMGKLMKAATLTSLKALREAGTDCPDAIITATAYGMLETSERFLRDMVENGEQGLSPTLFMQSTHNTIGSQIAIRTKCHGYNITYSQGAQSLEWALRDARRLIATGKAETVLVGCHDEATPTFRSIMQRMGASVPPAIFSRSIVLKKKN